MLGCQVAEAENVYVLASLSTSSTASAFIAVANNMQSKVAMALVSLSSVAALFDGDGKLMASAVRMPMIRFFLFFYFFEKRARHASAVVHARMRDKTYPVQVSFSDSLWARIRRSRTNVGPRIQDSEENESADSKTFLKFYFDLIASGPGSRTICTGRLSCLVLKPSLSTSVTSSLSSPTEGFHGIPVVHRNVKQRVMSQKHLVGNLKLIDFLSAW